MFKTLHNNIRTALQTGLRQHDRNWWLQSLQRPGRLFLLLAIPFGLSTAILLPPFMSPDEGAHLFRAYQVSEGGIFSTTINKSTGGHIPIGLTDALADLGNDAVRNGLPPSHVSRTHYLTTKADLSNTTFAFFDTSAVYSPFSYVPQALGVLVAKLTYASPLAMLYLGRLANLAAFICLIYLAIRWAPMGKWVIAVAALFPMAIHQAGSLSTDVTTIGLSFVAVALFLKIYLADKQLTRRTILPILGLALLLGLTKQTNALMVLPFLFLPVRFFDGLKQKLLFCAGLLASAFGGALVWYLAIKIQDYNMAFTISAGADQQEQLRAIIHNPITYVSALIRTFFLSGTRDIGAAAGLIGPNFFIESAYGVFSWIRYKMPLPSMVAGYGILLAALLLAPPAKTAQKITGWIRTGFGMTFIGSILAMATILYLIWTPVGSPFVEGIQGRYFIPLLPLLIPLFVNTKVRLQLQGAYTAGLLFGGISALNLAIMLALTIQYFY